MPPTTFLRTAVAGTAKASVAHHLLLAILLATLGAAPAAAAGEAPPVQAAAEEARPQEARPEQARPEQGPEPAPAAGRAPEEDGPAQEVPEPPEPPRPEPSLAGPRPEPAPLGRRRPEWAVSFGSLDVLDSVRETEGTVEVRLAPWTRLPVLEGLVVEPAFGVTGTDEGSLYLYSCFRVDLFQAIDWVSGRAYERGGPPAVLSGEPRRWEVVPFTGVGLYGQGDDGKRLGGLVEFRSGLEVSVRVGERSRLGVAFYHLSNAGIYDANPGTESLVLVWSRR